MNAEPKAELGRSDGAGKHRLPAILRAMAPISTLAGALGSVGLMLWTGRHNESVLLLVLFTFWVVSPFLA